MPMTEERLREIAAQLQQALYRTGNRGICETQMPNELRAHADELAGLREDRDSPRVSICHVAPDEAAIERNRSIEPDGERLRMELVAWLEKNNVVCVYLDTATHVVQIDSAKLPPQIRNVLSKWGSIYVIDAAMSEGGRG